jgi:electron transfer flavoprotein alpha subunit
MAEILVYSDKPEAARELAFKGKEFAVALGLGLSAAALGADAEGLVVELTAFGADKIYVSDDAALEGLHPDVVAEALAQIAGQAGATHVLVASTRRGKELAGRLAQKLGAGALSDVNTMGVKDGELIGGRYALGGNTVAEERIQTAVKVFAVMPKTFEVGAPQAGAGEVVKPALSLTPSAVKVVDRRAREGQAVNLDAALRIVGVGRGFGKREDLDIAQALAAALEAELGCTKSIADFEWLSEDRIIGLSGAKTKPDVYIALGISGQIQHTVGISQSKLIAAVNKDKEAPIFALADYGIVGDIFQVVPALMEKLNSM